MSPRPGGEADKLGNHYEGAWTAFHLLEVLAGRAVSVTAEALEWEGRGIEFVVRRVNAIEAHQVKRQRGTANYWTLGNLRSEGVLEAARLHVAAGRQFHFVSTIPAQELNDLAERARRSPDVQAFVNTLPEKSVRPNFNYLCGSTAFGSPQIAWDTLRGIWVRWPGERDIRNFNAALAGLLLSGAPAPAAAVTLCDLVVDSGLAVPLDHQGIVERLANYELKLSALIGSISLNGLVNDVVSSWKDSIRRELLRPSIRRAETSDLVEMLAGEDRRLLVVGSGGAGKSAELYEVVDRLESIDWKIFAFRLDRVEPFTSTIELGQRFGLGVSPVSVLAAVAQDRDSLLVIDQLDAVSMASGRMPQTFDAVADLVREAGAFPRMRVVLACRKFDVDNDDRIRTLIKDTKARGYEVSQLSDAEVSAAVEAMGIASALLSAQQKQLLRLPLHLKVLSSIADQVEAFSFATTKDLFDAYWERKRRDCGKRRTSVRFVEVIAVAVEEMSSRQRLSVSLSIFDEGDLSADADVLASEHVLVRDGRQVSFFHETFFDYAFARRWTRTSQTLVDFLIAGEQELFRRAQVRQVLTYLREDDPQRFITETEALLADQRIRYHIKAVAFGVLGALPSPAAAEWRMVERLLSSGIPGAGRLWLSLLKRPWFERLDAQGAIEVMLARTDRESHTRALQIMASVVKEVPNRIAVLLALHAGQASDYPAWLRWIARSDAVRESRPLFNLVLESVRRSEYHNHERELFMSVRGLATHQPEWAVELLIAHLIERPGARSVDSSGRVSTLLSRDHNAIEMLAAAASGAPRRFAEAMVPYMLEVAALTAQGDEIPIIDRHFLHHVVYRDRERPYHEVEEALQVGAGIALRSFVGQDPEAARPLLERLAADPHNIAQWLLFETLTAAGQAYAEYSAVLVLDREGGFRRVGSSWTLRLLIQAISPHLSDESFARLEQAAIDFRPSWDSRPPGQASFTLLSAMNEGRLSQRGRRRLGELRRLSSTGQPPGPPEVTGGAIGSPIRQEAAQRMTDDQWLRAMAKHNTDRTDWAMMRGGAQELSQVLKEEVKNDPARFARLALKLTSEYHSVYGEAILQGLGEADVPVDPVLIFEAVRHAAAVFDGEADRWLGWALRKHLAADIPDDIIAILIDRALHSADPEHDSWSLPSANGTPYYGGDPLFDGINTGRGHNAEMLGDLLVHDVDGHRTALVVPLLNQMASDPSVAVRACVAHLIAACLRHASGKAVAAFPKLVDAHDRLLATPYVESLIVYIGDSESAAVEPVIRRMIVSAEEDVRKVGGRLAAYAGLELELETLLAEACASSDPSVREGAADTCAARITHTANVPAAAQALRQFFHDPHDDVRQAAAGLTMRMRDRPLRPFAPELFALIDSPAFSYAVPQLLITLERAPDRVDDLVLACAKQFVEVHGTDAGDTATGAAADAREVGELLIRAYAQAPNGSANAAVLDLIDSLLASGAWGIAELVEAAER